MPFSLQAFADTRPYLYHLTSVENLLGIKSCRTLKSAATLVREKDQLDLTQRRVNPISLSSSVTSSWLQTQRPLHFGNILFEGGWQMKDLLTRINSLVFFWPGTSEGPIPHGRRHFRGNDWPTACVALRVRTQTLFDSLGGSEPLFCTYNSGSPRCSGGKKSPRGPNTFFRHFASTEHRQKSWKSCSIRMLHCPHAQKLPSTKTAISGSIVIPY
jgi:hypothetical protein